MRRSTLLLSSLSAAVLISGAALAQEFQISEARMNEDTRILASDEFEGRGVATPGEQRTIEYIAQQFAAAGLQPGGVDGTWYQPVTLRRFETSNASGALSVGDWTLPLHQGEEAVFSTRRPAEHVHLEDAELVFVGYGINAPERDWNDFKGMDLRGKVLVVLVNDADFEEPELDTFGGRAMTYYGRWTYKYEEAARQGAAGVLIVHETAPASYGWNTVRNSWSQPQFDIVRANPEAERIPLEGWIQLDVARQLFQRAGLDFDALKAQARSRDFRPVTLEGAQLDAMMDVSTETVETRNVVARLEGSTHPEESILYMAHWDHLGVGEPDADGDAIFNGAVDNATGIATLLEIARAFAAGPRPERSIVFLALTAEESGLLGAEYYGANPLYPLETTVAGINMDAMGVWGPTRDLSVIGWGQSDLDQRLERLAASQDRTISPDSTPEAGFFFRSDHFPMAKRGVPMAYAGSGDVLVEGGREAAAAASAAYTRDRYHQVNDEWSPDWNLGGMAQDAELFWRMGLELANSRDWPRWAATSEFGPARTASDDRRR
ncbi:M28 family metallopeptidase [Brevundimonas sp. 2R-24]|uniref:M28 family metallopeptidase n=1 Tax=Peiella sedimenti TaxID=3061083 RepID=A0ABT8SI87_9CAUL|nr:M28 family metallopeptidase [Caulobacteraceae bacterium XZ-24]